MVVSEAAVMLDLEQIGVKPCQQQWILGGQNPADLHGGHHFKQGQVVWDTM